MTSEENFPLTSLSAFIFDLDGVIWRGHTPIAGAVESIARLRAAGKKCFYCTNNASLTQHAFAERLRAIGLELEDSDVISSAWATAQFLAQEFPAGFSAFVVGEAGLQDTLRAGGATIVQDEDAGATTADCVVAGIDRSFSYQKLYLAQQQIVRGARFVATNRDATFPLETGIAPGAGSIIAAIATASGTEPLTIGKPQPLMLQLCVEKFGLDPRKTAMVGDRLDTDIACAHRAGLPALLVTTGVTSREVGQAATGEEAPDAIFEDLPEMVSRIEETED